MPRLGAAPLEMYYVGGDVEDNDVGDDGGQQPEQVTGLQGGVLQLGAGICCRPRFGGGLEVEEATSSAREI